MDLFNKMMGKDTSLSKNVAKERLRLVLVHDRSSISPQLLEKLKSDMMKVISSYMEIDSQGTEVTLNTDENTAELIANIPVKKINRM